ncbi:hypothetical protein BDF14DRAFT_1722358 [Spinellus fusiger]|nr:hypothetical protein BDF14DRAFT_1722358 [Spinellus fusiger]
MVHAVICSLTDSKSRQELVYLDFQGSFTSEEGDELKNVSIGDITVKDDTAVIKVGHHRLEGKRVRLTKPLAVMKKQTGGEMNMEDPKSPTVAYETVCLLREKYIFSLRPSLLVQEVHRGPVKKMTL